MKRIVISIALFTSVGTATSANATIAAALPIYCKDSTGAIQYMKYFNYAMMVKGFQQKYDFTPKLDGNDTTLTFSDPGTTKFFLRYKIADYVGEKGPGYELLSLRVNMAGARETMVGNDLCLFTMNNVLEGQ